MNKQNRTSILVLSILLTTLMLTSLACNLFSPQEDEEVVEEILIIEEPEPGEVPAWSPELVFQLTHESDSVSIGGVAYTQDGTLIGAGYAT